EEGLYDRQRVDAKLLKPGQKNVLAVEVHQAAATSSDLFFDLALKVLPGETAEARVSLAAQEIITLFNKQHYIGPGVKVPDGYIDGGRGMKVDGGGTASSGREILTIDRKHDTELAADLALARSSEMRALPELQRIERIATLIDKRTTPPAGLQLVGKTTEQLEKEFTNKPVLIGDWVDQCHAGVCRHRALLFKILGDEAGLKTALVRGNYAKQGPPGFAHAWNEVELGDGHRVLVDVMHNGGKPKFRELNSEYVIEHYLKVDGHALVHERQPLGSRRARYLRSTGRLRKPEAQFLQAQARTFRARRAIAP
ncbi:MAG TPA: EDR1-related protein, partial [Pirellulales bacterium]|nr:EDR1-related protein [Pirellulales bacterium]